MECLDGIPLNLCIGGKTLSTDRLLGWTIQKKLSDILAVEEELAKEISENLRLKLSVKTEKLLAKRYTQDVEAYHLYLKGRYYCYKKTEDTLYKGIEHFRQAIERDPTYALAYAVLGDSYLPLGYYCSRHFGLTLSGTQGIGIFAQVGLQPSGLFPEHLAPTSSFSGQPSQPESSPSVLSQFEKSLLEQRQTSFSFHVFQSRQF